MRLLAPLLALVVVEGQEPLRLREPQALPQGPHSMPEVRQEPPRERQPESQSLSAQLREQLLPARNLHYSEQVRPLEPEQVLNSCTRSKSGMLKERSLPLKPGIYLAWGSLRFNASIERKSTRIE